MGNASRFMENNGDSMQPFIAFLGINDKGSKAVLIKRVSAIMDILVLKSKRSEKRIKPDFNFTVRDRACGIPFDLNLKRLGYGGYYISPIENLKLRILNQKVAFNRSIAHRCFDAIISVLKLRGII